MLRGCSRSLFKHVKSAGSSAARAYATQHHQPALAVDAVVVGAGQAGETAVMTNAHCVILCEHSIKLLWHCCTGLATAYYLTKAGISHVVIDANPEAGGAWQHR
jgi:ribulose 1,5-bisphosphate synthetase/thiazole synthase